MYGQEYLEWKEREASLKWAVQKLLDILHGVPADVAKEAWERFLEANKTPEQRMYEQALRQSELNNAYNHAMQNINPYLLGAR